MRMTQNDTVAVANQAVTGARAQSSVGEPLGRDTVDVDVDLNEGSTGSLSGPGAVTVVCAAMALMSTLAVFLLRASLWWTLVPILTGLVGFVAGMVALPRAGRAGERRLATTVGLVLCALTFSGWAAFLLLIWTMIKALSLVHWDF
jgi:hypothetical protein